MNGSGLEKFEKLYGKSIHLLGFWLKKPGNEEKVKLAGL